MIHDYNGYPINSKKSKYIFEKCIFCGKIYKSKIDKRFDICPKCEDLALEGY